MVKSIAILGLSLSSLLVSGVACADWQVNNDQSKVSFVSIKSNSIAEVHHFKNVSGSLAENGSLSVDIDLSSVETMIPIRNERMTKLLFETAKFPTATITANLSKQLKALKPGQHVFKGISAELDFHGAKKEITVDVIANLSSQGDISVSSMSPIIINGADFAVIDGIMQLQKLAGLPSIATAVPVSFSLTMNKLK
ncbi:YceI family protein [Pseudoalteromonas sp. SR44-5]|uniref:YceI family protein n=1 Tax=Pseudoalteromonas TaxID=53246 RepID=UPI0015FF42FA|nr:MULTISPECIES: YceI family protein [unclassified Pseudoalteromonas]MBB1332805.1 YceI family protein [Pseudoalteromonas sp. SR41-6]MBB1365873.1 YceI family protein [Pseudoalteromonas sp. SR44-5]MBB1416200.1 YceI family protein [Pseudoalteromonas sp. SG44-1]MBB1434090.1 YceI family protein [Pseudoalteromonas sp. SG43-6]MBB1459006.1 YceI family protein [Pseudoalteromonas sp. SG41-8]